MPALNTGRFASRTQLAHVSTACRLREDEELVILKNCVCDPYDRRFDHRVHTVHSVTLCKNRRSELRARHSWRASAPLNRGPTLGAAPICVCELPPRPTEDDWVYNWSSLALETSAGEVQEMLQELVLEYKHSSHYFLDELVALIVQCNDHTKSNQPNCRNPNCTDPNCRSGPGGAGAADVVKKMFLSVYGLFQGSVQCRNGVSDDAFGVSFATLLLGLVNSTLTDKSPSILSSILLTMARVPVLGPFMPEFVDLRPQSQRRSDRFVGVPGPEEAESSLGRLIHAALAELRALSGGGNAYREVTRRMASRRSEALTKQLMFRGFGDSYDVGWGGFASGGTSNFSFSFTGGGANGGRGGRAVEDTADAIEKKCAEQVEHLSLVKEIRRRGTARPDGGAEPVDDRKPNCPLAGCELTVVLGTDAETLPQISDFSCASRQLHATSALPLANLGAEKMRHFAHMPLGALATEAFVKVVPRASLGTPPVSGKMRFDVSAHPSARSKVANDMAKRIASDVELFASVHNTGGEFRCTFIDAEEIVANSAKRRDAEATLKTLIELLQAQRDADAQYVREALPVAMKKAHEVGAPPISSLRFLGDEEYEDSEMDVDAMSAVRLSSLTAGTTPTESGESAPQPSSDGRKRPSLAGPIAGVKRPLSASEPAGAKRAAAAAGSSSSAPVPEPPTTEPCAICFMDDVPRRTTWCKHHFCDECLEGYLATASLPVTCPLCRQRLETEASQASHERFQLEQMSSQKMRASLCVASPTPLLCAGLIRFTAASLLRLTPEIGGLCRAAQLVSVLLDHQHQGRRRLACDQPVLARVRHGGHL